MTTHICAVPSRSSEKLRLFWKAEKKQSMEWGSMESFGTVGLGAGTKG